MTIYWIMIVIVVVIMCNESMYISSFLALPCLALPWLVLSCVELTSITIVIIGMTLYDLVLHYITISYHIISYHISCSFILSLLLIWSPFHSILFYFISNRFDLILFYSILFYWIWFTILFSIVSHINEWFVSICPSVCLSVCMNKFLFSLFFSLFSWTSSSLKHGRTDTDTQIHMNICSFLWLVHITSKGCKWRIVFDW